MSDGSQDSAYDRTGLDRKGPGRSGRNGSAAGCSHPGDLLREDFLFLSLRETAEWHGIDPTYLSRRVRKGKAAKGHRLRPYALTQRQDGKEKIKAFAFPEGYKPTDSAASEADTKSKVGRAGERRAGGVDQNGPEAGAPVGKTAETVEELKASVGRIEDATETLASVLLEMQDRQERIERALRGPAGELQKWKKEQRGALHELRTQFDDHARELRKMLTEQSEEGRERYLGLVDRIEDAEDEALEAQALVRKVGDELQEGMRSAREDLEENRKEDLRRLADQLEERILKPLVEILREEESSEDEWMNALGFGAGWLLFKVLEKRPDLLSRAAAAREASRD